MILLSVTPIYKQFEEAYKPLLITLGNANFRYLINHKRAYYHTKQKVRDAAYCLEIYQTIVFSLPYDIEDRMFDISHEVFRAYGAFSQTFGKYYCNYNRRKYESHNT